MRLHLSACISLVLLASAARAQQCTSEIAVNAFDAATRDVLYGLSAADFEAVSGQSTVQITAVKPVFRNRVLVLLDVGSMPDRQSLATVAELVSEAPPGMPVAFGIFARQAAFTPGFITDAEALGPALRQVTVRANSLGAGVNLHHALHQALQLFGNHRPGDTILLVTSGTERESKASAAKLRREFLRSGTRLQLLMGLSPSGAYEASQLFAGWDAAEHVSDGLVSLANSTGGALMGFMNSDWLHAASSGYMLSVVASPGVTTPRNWSLRVRDAGNDVPPAVLFYPEQLAPCTAPMIAALPAKAKPRP